MTRISKFFWMKVDGSIKEISREKCLKLEKTHTIAWTDGVSINFISKITCWYPIEQIQKVIDAL